MKLLHCHVATHAIDLLVVPSFSFYIMYDVACYIHNIYIYRLHTYIGDSIDSYAECA